MNGRVDFPREHWMQFEKIKNLTNIGVEIQNERTELLQNIVFYSWQRERFFQWQMKQISSVSSVIETDMKVAEVQFIEGSIVILSERHKVEIIVQIIWLSPIIGVEIQNEMREINFFHREKNFSTGFSFFVQGEEDEHDMWLK